jgi:hypothetical protein
MSGVVYVSFSYIVLPIQTHFPWLHARTRRMASSGHPPEVVCAAIWTRCVSGTYISSSFQLVSVFKCVYYLYFMILSKITSSWAVWRFVQISLPWVVILHLKFIFNPHASWSCLLGLSCNQFFLGMNRSLSLQMVVLLNWISNVQAVTYNKLDSSSHP